MLPSPLKNGGSPKYAKLPKHPDAAAQALDSRAAKAESSKAGAKQYIPYRPGATRANAGDASPLIDKNGFEEIPLQDMSPKKAGKRREHPIDPSLANITASSSRPRANSAMGSAEVSPRASMESTDEVGLPLPVTAKGKGKAKPRAEGQSFLDQVKAEEEEIIARNKKVGKAAGAVLGVGTAAAIGVVTWKTGPF